MLARMALSINPRVAGLICSLSGERADARGFRRPPGLCRCCPPPGKPLLFEYDLEHVRAEMEKEVPEVSGVRGIFRYASLLPVRGADPDYAADVGDTPTMRSARLADLLGVELYLKTEGGNPSGSFKDRGLAIGVALGVACGASRFCLATQGNAGVAAALFSARLGLEPPVVYMPDGFQQSLYGRACTHFGAEVRCFGRNLAEAGARMRDEFGEPLERGDLVDLSTFLEPGRLEGKKTLGLEIVDQLGAFGLPEWILYPTGGGTGLCGIWKALSEYRELGRIESGRSLPRLVAVQSEACAPVVRAFERGLDHVEPVESRGTIADGLDVPRAIMGHRILAALRESRGIAISVSELGIARAFAEYGRLGVCAGYESAALLAALRRLLERGVIEAGTRVLLLLTSGPLAALSPTKSVHE